MFLTLVFSFLTLSFFIFRFPEIQVELFPAVRKTVGKIFYINCVATRTVFFIVLLEIPILFDPEESRWGTAETSRSLLGGVLEIL